MTLFRIGDDFVVSSSTNRIFVIAEIGQNHQGSLSLAKDMIVAAKKCGCDCVKFQKSHLPTKFTKSALCREYNGPNSWAATYGEHKEFLEFSLEEFQELKNFTESNGLIFSASAMDQVSLQHLVDLNLKVIKIGSGDANNFPLLKKAAQLPVPLIISTGMQTMQTIRNIVNIMQIHNKQNYALLHCISSYPALPSDVALPVIQLFHKEFPNLIIGYSGHEEGILISQAAILLGAKIIERHFTLDKSQKGSDHCCSLNELELSRLVKSIRKLENQNILNEIRTVECVKNILKEYELSDEELTCLEHALAEVPERIIFPCELDCRKKLGKSLCYARDLPEGWLLRADDLCVKVSEPFGISAEYIEKFLNRILKVKVSQDDCVELEHFAC